LSSYDIINNNYTVLQKSLSKEKYFFNNEDLFWSKSVEAAPFMKINVNKFFDFYKLLLLKY